ncbi:MAG: protein phosphatase 2C domain-containing protein [Ruminococcus sp.]|nr:protein phosphatase 2C domain-containing protein [Ruminococcus sp.]
MFKGFSHSVMGASHEKKGIVCQDSSAYEIGEGYAVAVVADGHGSKKHFRSNIGSKCAVDAVLEAIKKFYEDPEEFERLLKEDHDRMIRKIEKYVIFLWNNKVLDHLEKYPVTRKESSKFEYDEFAEIPFESYYGTTLIAAVAGNDYTFGFQIGDGSLVAVFEDGETSMIMDYEEANPANITSSMCNANAYSMFDSFYVDDKKLLAICVSTDGLYTSFGSDFDFLDYHTIIAGQLANPDAFMNSLQNNLVKRSHFGTEDDISLSCVYNEELAISNNQIIKDKIAANKKAAAERRANIMRT